VVLKDIPADYASVARGGGERPLRGAVEASPFPGRRALALVNVVDLESYTHGVLASEMPIVSPVEALKAQAVVARTHALFIKTVTLRHKKDGFDICDGQHCQVYWGVRNESAKSRAIVEATRGRVVAYEGRIAHVLYASNCGGHTQSGKDLRGWGNVPYWKGVTDADPRVRPPASPWELRLWLRTRPAAFCRASSFVHPSHFRWTRVIPAADLEDRINRSLKIGRLLGIRTLQRSPSGHLNSVAVVGSRQSPVVSKEISIRGLLGDGSQRSALFMVETESDEKGRPLRFTFYGGGWGHGVGMCQSGAIGRAGEGRSYADILASYYAGTQLGNLRY
jgi:SpoIID/LytB domain protein